MTHPGRRFTTVFSSSTSGIDPGLNCVESQGQLRRFPSSTTSNPKLNSVESGAHWRRSPKPFCATSKPSSWTPKRILPRFPPRFSGDSYDSPAIPMILRRSLRFSGDPFDSPSVPYDSPWILRYFSDNSRSWKSRKRSDRDEVDPMNSASEDSCAEYNRAVILAVIIA